MAEILLKIGDGANYQDGDVLAAFNNRRIRQCHAEHVCFERDLSTRQLARRNGIGCLDMDDVGRDFCESTCEFRMERLSKREARMTRIATGESVRFTSNVPFTDLNGKTVAMDIDVWAQRRLKTLCQANARGLPLFGAHVHHVVWYGGRHDVSNVALNAVWSKIAEKTGRLESEGEFQLWPMGRLDIRHHLAVRVVDFTDEESQGFVKPQYKLDQDGNPVLDEDEQPIVIAKRNITVDWRANLLDDLGVTEAAVLDPDTPVGRDVEIQPGRLRHHSKEQPEQSQRSKLHSRELGGPLPEVT